ncbi:MAG: outer membrane beta-barrel protein [Desulfohalobiaceae bacterium]
MKRLVQLLACVLFSLCLVGGAHAQNGNALNIDQQLGVFGSYQDTDDLDDGYGGGLRYALFTRVADPAPGSVLEGIDIGGDVRASWLADYDEDAFDTDMYPAQANLLVRAELQNGFRPYAGGGVGYVWFDNDDKELDDEYSYSALLGFDQMITERFSLFVEGEYMWLEPDYDNMSGDADMDGFGVNAGVNFNF